MIARRVLIGMAAAALLIGGGVPAHAQWRGGGRGGGAWARQGGGPRGGFGGGWRQGAAPAGLRGGFRAYGGGGYGYAPAPGGPPFARPAFGGSPFAGPGAGRAWRRGQVLPQDYRGADVADPGRYHLRRAPAGYGWVGDGRNAYLMQRSTGMVLDSVPGAYDPPPPGYGRGR